MPRLLVTDANILIDLAIAESGHLLLINGYQVVVSFDVYYEIKLDQRIYWQPYVDDGRLQLEEADENILTQLRTQHSKKLSDPDLTFFALLTDDNCIATKYVTQCKHTKVPSAKAAQ